MKSHSRAPLLVAGLVTACAAQADFNIGGMTVGIQPRLNGGAMYYEYSQPAVSGGFTTDEILQIGIDAGLPEQTAEVLANNALTSITTGEFEVSTMLPVFGGGATVFLEHFFIDGYAQQAFEASGDTSQVIDESFSFSGELPLNGLSVPVGLTGVQRTNQRFNVDIDRTEWSIALGYAITERFAAYAGYKNAETTFEQKGAGGEATIPH
jgi:hypothetical protein